jgi:hypothetical protein
MRQSKAGASMISMSSLSSDGEAEVQVRMCPKEQGPDHLQVYHDACDTWCQATAISVTNQRGRLGTIEALCKRCGRYFYTAFATSSLVKEYNKRAS